MNTCMYVHGVVSVEVEVHQTSRAVVCTSYIFRDAEGGVTEVSVFHPDIVELHSASE